jgi:hypothetical protein
MNTRKKILEEFELPEGLEIDITEGWKKITGRQFGGDPGRGIGELIQNLLDSYPQSVPMEQRRGVITTDNHSFSITDFGEGFTLEKIKLIITLGGTDKSDDASKIGQFGIGFFSIFNRALGTEKVTITTKCEGFTVQIVFDIHSFDEVPKLKMDILDEPIDYSTKIEVSFRYRNSVDKCLNYTNESLNYYPCKITINGKPYQSIWETAKISDWLLFDNQHCNGFVKPYGAGNRVNMLCKYEHIMKLTLSGLLCGAAEPKYTLEDYRHNSFPYVPHRETVINCNNLTLTISRDSFYLNYHYINMLNDLREEFYRFFLQSNPYQNKQLALANSYIFSKEIGRYLKTGEIPSGSSGKKKMIEKLSDMRAFYISGSKKQYSLKELKEKLTPGLPLFYSPNKTNIRWLGGAFKHDFVILPERCQMENGADNFYHTLFSDVFEEIVDLDRIQGNNKMIEKLVKKGIVSQEALSPKIEFVGEKRLSGKETSLLHEINQLLKNKEITEVIEKNLYFSVRSITAIFFEIQQEGAYISTGIFNQDMNPISEDFISNLEKKEEGEAAVPFNSVDILLGLRKDHPLIQQLCESDKKHRSYFALTYIAHELAFCQRLLVPYSSFFHFTKEKLAAGMRKALMNNLLEKAA